MSELPSCNYQSCCVNARSVKTELSPLYFKRMPHVLYVLDPVVVIFKFFVACRVVKQVAMVVFVTFGFSVYFLRGLE